MILIYSFGSLGKNVPVQTQVTPSIQSLAGLAARYMSPYHVKFEIAETNFMSGGRRQWQLSPRSHEPQQ